MSKATEAEMSAAPQQGAPPPAYPGGAPQGYYPPTGQQGAPPPGQAGYYPPAGQAGAPPPGQAGYYPPAGQAGAPPPGQPYPQAQPYYPKGQPYPQGGPPPRPQYQQPGQPQTTVVVAQPQIVTGQAFREAPVTMVCPHCQASITSSTHYESGNMVYIVAAAICGIGCFFPLLWLGCCFIPFCVNSLKNVIHECPNCHREVGRMDRTR